METFIYHFWVFSIGTIGQYSTYSSEGSEIIGQLLIYLILIVFMAGDGTIISKFQYLNLKKKRRDFLSWLIVKYKSNVRVGSCHKSDVTVRPPKGSRHSTVRWFKETLLSVQCDA